MASVDLQEKANFTRLSRLLVDKGTQALRNTFDGIHPPASLPTVLAAKRKSLLKLKFRAITKPQWDLLYPPSSVCPPDSKHFDVSLLTILFRNICNLPSTGWSGTPAVTDRSLQANIIRIKSLRNKVYAHVTSTRVDNATFESLWQKISQILVELNIPQKDVDDLKTCPLGPEEKLLKDWKLDEEECKTVLGDLKDDVNSMEFSISHLTQLTEENHDGIKKLCQSSFLQQQSDKEVSQSSMARPPQLVEDLNIETNRSKDEDLLLKLAKHNFHGKIRNRVKYFQPGTREWLFKDVDEWFIGNEQVSKMFLLTAGPGFGKSVFAAKICENFKMKGKLGACHFCDFSDSNLRNPMMMLQSLASQMCENLAGFKEKLLDQLKRPHEVHTLKDAFQIYLQNPLDELEAEEPTLVVIDGLDESASDDKNEIVSLIADYFPDLPYSIKFLVTSRPEISITNLKDIKKLNIESKNVDNNSDLQIYLKYSLPSLHDRKADNHSDVLEMFVKMCEGSFLYAYHAQSELQERNDLDKVTLNDIIEFLPKGLDSVYRKYFRRLEDELKAINRCNLDVLRVLEMLVASKEPLPLAFVAQALGLATDCRETQTIIDKVNETLSCLLYVSDERVTIFHKSVIDWLLSRGYKDHEYTVTVNDGNRSLWLMCEQTFEKIKKAVCTGCNRITTYDVGYTLNYGFVHLAACKTKEHFYWLVDVFILYALFCTSVDVGDMIVNILFIWRDFVRVNDVISDELRARISWHIVEIDSIPRPRSINPLLYYLQSVIAHSPEGYFSNEEKKIAESLLSDIPRFADCTYYKNEVEVMPLAFWSVSPKKKIRAVCLSKDKSMAAIAQKDGMIFVICIPRLLELLQYSTKYESISCCAFAPDDSFLLFGKLEIALDIAQRKEVPFFHGNKETFVSCAFSPNGKKLITSDDSTTIKVWDVTKQRLVSRLFAGVRVNRCHFNSTGLFIIGYKMYSFDEVESARQRHRADSYTEEWESYSDYDYFYTADSVTENRESDSDFESDTENPESDSYFSIENPESDTDSFRAEVDPERSFCVWNSFTLQRCDERILPVLKTGSALDRKLCKRCFRPGLEILPMCGSCIFVDEEVSSGIYNGVNCSYFMGERSLYVIENTHFTTLALWNWFTDGNFYDISVNYDSQDEELSSKSKEIESIDNDQWLYSDERKVVVVKTSVPAPRTAILWISFSPDGYQLATCTSDGRINIWNVHTKQVEQRFKTNQPFDKYPFVCCWWSEKFLFVFCLFANIPSLWKYPVDMTSKIQFNQSQQVSLDHLVDEFISLSQIVDFSGGLLCFKCDETEPVKIIHVDGVGEPRIVTLPGIKPKMSISVSPGASFVCGGEKDKFCICKRNTVEAAVYDVFLSHRLKKRRRFTSCPVVGFSNDSKVAVVSYSAVESLVSVIIDLDTGIHENVWFHLGRADRGWFCINKDRVVIAASRYRKFIDFYDMDSGARLWSTFNRYLKNDYVQIKLSPNDTVLVFAKINADVEFLRLSIPAQNPLMSDIKRKAAIERGNLRARDTPLIDDFKL